MYAALLTIKVCEISFCRGGFAYTFDVDVETGKILKFEKD